VAKSIPVRRHDRRRVDRGSRRLRVIGAVLTPRARARLAMLEWHRAHGANVARTARHFGFSRPTVYRWLGRYDRFRLSSLEDRGSGPHRRRRPTWTAEDAEAVARLRGQYPRWGKEKLAVLLAREGRRRSVSMIGRILARLRRRGVLAERAGPRARVRRRAPGRPYAVRLPRGLALERPGDLVELDTLDVRPLPSIALKQFTARDRASRWDVLEVHDRATARTATDVLERILARMPFPVRAISVDNGPEFMAEFEHACARRGIALYCLPPRSPKLHGTVERANRTHTEEFWEVTDAEPTPAAFRTALLDWERTYNTIRPHQALGYLTPAEYLASVGVDV
jgi:putative transposase